MRGYLRIAFFVLIYLLFVTSAFAQETQWKKLTTKFEELYQQGKNSDGEKIAISSLELAKKTFVPDYPNVATSLSNLALLYRVQGR